jgi:hypothetical protein
MATSFSLTSAIKVFPCPSCGETINTTLKECSFCHAAIDPAAAEQSAAATALVSRACNDASYLTVMAGLLLPFFLLLFFPLMTLVGFVGMWFLTLAIPFMCIRWWVKYGKIKTTDSDFSNARGRAIGISVAAAALIIARTTGILHY